MSDKPGSFREALLAEIRCLRAMWGPWAEPHVADLVRIYNKPLTSPTATPLDRLKGWATEPADADGALTLLEREGLTELLGEIASARVAVTPTNGEPS